MAMTKERFELLESIGKDKDVANYELIAEAIAEVRRLRDIIESAKDCENLAIAGEGRWYARMKAMIACLKTA